MSWMTQNVEQGVLPILRAATDPSVLGGQYYGPDGFMGAVGRHPVVVTSSTASYDAESQRRLWEVSEELTGVTYETEIGGDGTFELMRRRRGSPIERRGR